MEYENGIQEAVEAFNSQIEEAKNLGSADKNLNTDLEKSAEENVKEIENKEEQKIKDNAKLDIGGMER